MASKKDRGDYFWVSYSDLMTTLFFVMLVLFVISVALLDSNDCSSLESENIALIIENISLGDRIEELEKEVEGVTIDLDKYKDIVKIEQQFKQLEETNDFVYLDKCKKYVAKSLMGKEIFEPNKAVILSKYESDAIKVGRDIEMFLKQLEKENKGFSYLLVIEGNMANTYDGRLAKNSRTGYELSYKRALAVYYLWLRNSIDFRKLNVEVVIAGSGFNGLCRDDKEENNKRFSIQIIPKVSPIKNE